MFATPCCANCLYLGDYELKYSCVKHFCYVEASKVCDDFEDGRDHLSRYNSLATTAKGIRTAETRTQKEESFEIFCKDIPDSIDRNKTSPKKSIFMFVPSIVRR